MDDAQAGPPQAPWSEERRDAWNAGYLAGLNDATKFTGEALRDAIQRKCDRIDASLSVRTEDVS